MASARWLIVGIVALVPTACLRQGFEGEWRADGAAQVDAFELVDSKVASDAHPDVAQAPDRGADTSSRDRASDWPSPDTLADAQSPDRTPDTGSPETAPDTGSPETTPDTGLPETTPDTGLPDTTPDLVPRDTTVDAGGSVLWALSAGGTGNETAGGIALDSQGSLYFTGQYQGTLSFGGAGFSTTATVGDMFLASFTTGGAHNWSKGFSADYQLKGTELAVDSTNNVYVTGTVSGTANLGGADLTAVAGFASEILVASFTAAGGHRWSGSYGATNYSQGRDVVVDGSGNVTATGTSWGADFGAGVIYTNGASDCFAASFNSGGAYRWAEGFGSGNYDDGYAAAVDAAGNIYLVGLFRSSVVFDGVTLTAQNSDSYLISAGPDGHYRWSNVLGGTLQTSARAVAVDAAGNVIVAGTFSDITNLGGNDLSSAGGFDVFLVSYTAAGAHRWSSRYGGPSADTGSRLRVDPAGNITLAGTFGATADFGGTLVSAGGTDIFVLGVTSAGAFRYVERVGSADNDSLGGLAVGNAGDVYLSGTFAGELDLGTRVLTSAGGTDVFLMRLR